MNTIDGKITEMMESWPLQFVVLTDIGEYSVGLLSETKITRSGKKMEPGSLKPPMKVRIEGTISGERAMIAHNIEVLN